MIAMSRPLTLLTLTASERGNEAELSLTTAGRQFPDEIYLTVTTETKSRPTTGQIRLSAEQRRQLASALLELDRIVSIPYGEMPGSPGYPLTSGSNTDADRDPGNWKGNPIG